MACRWHELFDEFTPDTFHPKLFSLPSLVTEVVDFSWTLSRLLHGLTLGPVWTAKDSWYFWKSKSDHVLDSLVRQPQVLRVKDMFPEDLQSPEYLVWPGLSAETQAQ
ncbi:MAG: hypothetical protein NTV46_03345 [Verrucomicrobia bacterium]|nr:hypothetical protein [Verrucomicrobiota bacterium]